MPWRMTTIRTARPACTVAVKVSVSAAPGPATITRASPSCEPSVQRVLALPATSVAVVSGRTEPASARQATGTMPMPAREAAVTRTASESDRVAPMVST